MPAWPLEKSIDIHTSDQYRSGMNGILIGQDPATGSDIYAFARRFPDPPIDRVKVEVRIPRARVEWQGNYWTVLDGGTTVHTTNDYCAALRYAAHLNGEDV